MKNIHIIQNIYITNDEEIKDGNYGVIGEVIMSYSQMFKMWNETQGKKVILTTDQDLIKNGVQAIDDEFLKWFVKNPSCEEVNVYQDKKDYGTFQWYSEYKIIIPKEDPIPVWKQIIETCGGEEEFMKSAGLLPKQEELEEAKQKTPDEYLQVCKYCSSEEVARCKWVNVNTEEIYSADSGTNLEWCFDCKSETNIIDKEDYETKIQ
jgi:hypothetical protein